MIISGHSFRFWNLFITLFQLALVAQAKSASGSRTLVIYDKRLTDLEDYSTLFSNLGDRSFQLNYKPVSNDSTPIGLFQGEERLYDNLIIFPIRSRHFNKQLSVDKLLDFSNEGGHILTLSSPEATADNVRLFLNQLGIYPSPKNYHLEDYFQSGGDTPLRVSGSNVLNEHVVPSLKRDLIYGGSAALLDSSNLIVPVLQAPRTSFTKDSQKHDENWTVGSQGYIVVSFQSLQNSRVSWVGSDLFFNDKYASSNGQFVQELMKWTFGEKSIVKSLGARHKHTNGLEYSDMPYKVKDDVIYEIGLTEWDGTSWAPFIAKDIQFELKMIDPYYRITLKPSNSAPTAQYYTTGNFSLPDHHGIFTFTVDYKRSGLSFFTERDVKPIRHLANDEYPRSWEITNSWVYLTAIYSVIVAWALFVTLFLSFKRSHNVQMEKKNN
ncbi:LANO_0H19350g1_1 [Lachancea nothofagi CBS 11611]|uniref:Dolichyl-diphosphooligosaccharide--protein glycosyltransferase subunit WBP1 n=1 Tax=Lachancea nothofagi CBS 11611 TaxID=1266666 RepID=A0A1G4KNI4_9SACH|nr:LANO_0H19350g1_1 [Lachancea nothofagi CBS 11611]